MSFNKKKKRDLTKKQAQESRKNPRAFSFTSSARAVKAQRRNLDLGVKRQHLPIHSHVAGASASSSSEVEPPPFLVVVIGPRGTGKSSIICSLVKHYTSHSIPVQQLHGPVTVLTSGNRRLTLMECPPHLHCMIDLCKAADLVLLTVDASFGFELETFEALNVLKQHGMCRVMGVLTHLDGFRTGRQQQQAKRRLKHRFWTEICDGAKLFYLSGLLHGRYLRREISNLARFIAVIKHRPLTWRSSHPYLLADRMEELTPAADIHASPLCDRRVALYGFVRGTLLHVGQQLHWMGVGDFRPAAFTVLDDPVPVKRRKEEAGGGRRRKLSEKEKRLHAPMSDSGELLYDADAMYIHMHDQHLHFSREDSTIVREAEDETAEDRRRREEAARSRGRAGDLQSISMVRALQDISLGVDEKLQSKEISLFKHSTPLTADSLQLQDDQQQEEEEEEEEGGQEGAEEEEAEDDDEIAQLMAEEAKGGAAKDGLTSKVVMDKGRMRRKVVFDDEQAGDDGQHGADDGEADAADDSDDEQQQADTGVEDGEDDGYYEDNWEETKQQLRSGNSGRLLQLSVAQQKPAEEEKQATTERRGRAVRGGDSNSAARIEEVKETGPEADAQHEELEDEEEDGSADSAEEAEGAEDGGAAQSRAAEESKQEEADADDTQRDLRWKEELTSRAASSHQRASSLMDLVYGQRAAERNNARRHRDSQQQQQTGKLQLFDDDDEEDRNDEQGKQQQAAEDDDDDDDELFRLRPVRDVTADDVDSVVVSLRRDEQREAQPRDWQQQEVCDSIRNRFVTGDWSEEVQGVEDEGGDEDADSEAEEAEKRKKRKDRKGRRGREQSRQTNGAARQDEQDEQQAAEDEDEEEEEEEGQDGITVESAAVAADETEEQATERRRLAKERLKDSFDTEYDQPATTAVADGNEDDSHLAAVHAAAEQQAALNSSAFSSLSAEQRLMLEGARPGQYVRLELHGVPCEFIRHWSPSSPLVLGGLGSGESGLGYLSVRLKKHRWHPKILKSNDPLIFSLGWRRFQSCPVYAIEDRNERLRFLKYSPQHMHCLARLYAPLTPPNTGFVCYQYTDNLASFRIAATGSVLSQTQAGGGSADGIVKKLKLLGRPYRVFKHTAFIRDMFSSSTEVSRFLGASLRTVSGIRGAVKAAITTEGQDGVFRATFEDKILMSDIVVCRSWAAVPVLPYCAPVQSLLAPDHQWKGLRTIRQIRVEDGVPVLGGREGGAGYGQQVRRERKFAPLRVPRSLARQLPFASREKLMPPRASNRRLYAEARMTVRSEAERDMYRLMQQVNTVRGVKDAKRKEQREKQREKWQKQQQQETAKHAQRNREVRKRRYVAEGGTGRGSKRQRYGDK